jgi:hypothetical protein
MILIISLVDVSKESHKFQKQWVRDVRQCSKMFNLSNVCVEIVTSKCLSFIIKAIKAPIRIFVSDLHLQATLALS